MYVQHLGGINYFTESEGGAMHPFCTNAGTNCYYCFVSSVIGNDRRIHDIVKFDHEM